MKKIFLLALATTISLIAAEPKKEQPKKIMSEQELTKIQEQAEKEKSKGLDKKELSEIKANLLKENKILQDSLNKNLFILKDHDKCIIAIKEAADIDNCNKVLLEKLTKENK